jgi:hypothetical protein
MGPRAPEGRDGTHSPAGMTADPDGPAPFNRDQSGAVLALAQPAVVNPLLGLAVRAVVQNWLPGGPTIDRRTRRYGGSTPAC